MGYKKLFSFIKFLKSSLDLPHPIRVRFVELNGIDGDCVPKKNYFLIRIKKNLPEYYAIDVFIHEAGHYLAWDKTTDEDRHGLEWGKCYSIIYKKFLEWLENEENTSERNEIAHPL